MPTTTYLGATYPALSDAPNVPQSMQTLAGDLDGKLGGVILCTSGTRPTGRDGATIYETDTNRYMFHDGSGWQNLLETTTTSYTPSWTGSVSNPSLNNGTLSGQYLRIAAKLYWVRIQLVIGSTTTGGSGRWGFSLPALPTAAASQSLSSLLEDSSASARYPASAWLTNASQVFCVTAGAGGNVGISSTVPFTFAVGDGVLITGIYEAA